MAQSIGLITILHGTATATAADGTLRPLARGEPVFEDDLILTQKDSAIEIRFRDDTIMAQGENSQLLLDEYTYDPASGDGNLAFDMVQGTFRSVTGAIVDNNPENFELDTPLATIGIRGTVTAHTIPPAWAADTTEDHVVLVYDGKPVLVMTAEDGSLRLIDTSGRKVEVSDLGTSEVMVMTVAEYMFYEQLATGQLTGQEPQWNTPQDVIDANPGTDRPVGDNPAENLGDQNLGDENQGDRDGDGDEDDAQAARDELFKTIDSLILDGNGTGDALTQGTLLIGDELLVFGSTAAGLLGLQNFASYSAGSTDDLINTVSATGTTTASLPTVSFSTTGTITLTADQVSAGFVAAPLSTNNVTVTISVSSATPPPAGTSVTADFSNFNTTQAVVFNASAVTSGGYFAVTGGCCNDTIYGTNHNTDGDTINGGEGDDTLFGYAGDDTINGGDGEDTIYGFANTGSPPAGQSDNDTISGGAGQDTIYGNEGDDILSGDGEDDLIHGNDGNDTLTGGAGSDAMFGEDGNDIFVYKGTTGEVSSTEVINGGGDTDTIRVDSSTDFSSLTNSNVVSIEQLSITAGVTATFSTTQLSALNAMTFFGANNALSTVETIIINMAASGTLDLSSFGPFSDWGGEDKVTLNGTTGNDTFAFGTMYSDTFGANGGNGNNTLSFTSDESTTYTLARHTNISTFTLLDASTTIVTTGNLNYGEVVYIDASALSGTKTFNLNASAETGALDVKAGSGNNAIQLGSESDSVDFGSTTFDANDSLDGGGGNDSVTLLSSTTSANLNRLQNIETVTLTGSTNLNWTLDATVAGYVTTIDFSGVNTTSGTQALDASAATGNMTIRCGGSEGTSVTLGSGVDTVTGSGNSDTFIFGARYTDADTVNGGGTNDTDVLSFTSDGTTTYALSNISNVEQITLGAAATAITLGGSLTGSNSAIAVIIDGSGMGNNVLTFDSGSNSASLDVRGGDANDTFTLGSDLNDTIIKGNAGNDTLIFDGTTVSSRYAFEGGTGTDTIRIQGTVDFTENAIDNNFSSGVTNLTFADGASASFNSNAPGQLVSYLISGGSAGTAETLNIVTDAAGLDFSAFSPNLTNWGSNDVLKYTGTSDANTIIGSNDDLSETMYGGAGNDIFHLKGGNDALYGEDGDDTFDFTGSAGYFNNSDTVNGGDDTDTLKFTSDGTTTYTLAGVTQVETITLGNAASTTIDLAGSLGASNPSPTFDATALTGTFTFDGSNETTGLTLQLGSGTSTIVGSTGGDTINAGAGVDSISTGSGDDSIIFASDTLTIADSVDGGAGTADELTIRYATDTAALNATRNIEIYTFTNASGSFSWTLDDGVVDDTATVTFNISSDHGTHNCYFDGSHENGGSLIVNGSNDEETIKGGAGSDTITGGRSSDTLTGGAGSDIFKYTATNHGGDTITDFATGTDKLQFNSGAFSATADLVSGNYSGAFSYTHSSANACFVFDQDTGKLWYDPDGNGATATESLMATLHDGTSALSLDMDGNIATGDVDITVV